MEDAGLATSAAGEPPTVELGTAQSEARQSQQRRSAEPFPSTIAIRSATRRVDGSSGSKNARSHSVATVTENPSPISPVDSVIGRSSACR